MEERSLQPGDGSSSHVSTKEGMLAALEAFKRSLIEAEVELEVDITSAAVIDRLFDDIGRGGGVAGSGGKKKIGRQAGIPTLQFGTASTLDGKGMQQTRYDDDEEEEDSEGEHESDLDNEDFPDDGTVASSSIAGGRSRGNALQHLHQHQHQNQHQHQLRPLISQPPPIQKQKENDDTDELVEILNQLRRTSSASPGEHSVVHEKSINLGQYESNSCSGNVNDNLAQYHSVINDAGLNLLSPMDSYQYLHAGLRNRQYFYYSYPFILYARK